MLFPQYRGGVHSRGIVFVASSNLPNLSMHRTPLPAAADAERSPPKRPLQHRLPQLAAATEAGVNRGFDLIENGEAAFDFIGNHGLLCDRWEGQCDCLDNGEVEIRLDAS